MLLYDSSRHPPRNKGFISDVQAGPREGDNSYSQSSDGRARPLPCAPTERLTVFKGFNTLYRNYCIYSTVSLPSACFVEIASLVSSGHTTGGSIFQLYAMHTENLNKLILSLTDSIFHTYYCNYNKPLTTECCSPLSHLLLSFLHASRRASKCSETPVFYSLTLR